MEQEENKLISYKPAAETIKAAILQWQYEAAKGVNRIQLAVYFGIGKYISRNTRKGFWGTGALEAISQILRRELPGLKGYSASSMKNMRKFYESWQMLDSNSEITIADSEKTNSTIAIVELQNTPIDIYQSIRVPEIKDFPIEDFFKTPFTHHVRIIEGVKELPARYYYIHRTVEENIAIRALEKLIKDETIWATQKAMAQLFGVGIPAISKHLNNIFEESELDKEVAVSKMEITTQHGAIEGKFVQSHPKD